MVSGVDATAPKKKLIQKKSKPSPDNVWYSGWKKYREGAGAKLMRKGIAKYETWKVANPEASPRQVNVYLKTLCEVNLIPLPEIHRIL